MAALKYFVVHAFTSEVFGGNPAGVCPLESWLPDTVLQKLATKNGLSETAFVVADGDQFRIRWFTPTQEVVLCGHATLAAAFTIFTFIRPELDELCFQSSS